MLFRSLASPHTILTCRKTLTQDSLCPRPHVYGVPLGSFLPTQNKRSRNENVGSWQDRSNGTLPFGPKAFIQDFFSEEVLSQCHTGRWPQPRDSTVDVGGFMTLHRTWTKHTQLAPISASFTRGSTGIAAAIGYTFGINPAVAGSGSVMNAFGAKAIAAVLPTNPNASLATFLGELRSDGLPRLPGSSHKELVSNAKKAGDEYLNVEFGWLPFVSDLQSFADSVKRSRQLIDQYVRDSDRKIRRRYTPSELYSSATFPNIALQCYGQNITASGAISRTDSTRLWFSGAFRYHVPVGDDFYSRLLRYESLANHLFGTRITPELVWELAPWSWAIDWFTNAGDVIKNISLLGVDGLVMQYGYAMRHMRVEEIAKGSFSFIDGFGAHAGTVSKTFGSEWKQRVRANPYGFGIDDTSLTARQLAVLAALGLSKGKRWGL